MRRTVATVVLVLAAGLHGCATEDGTTGGEDGEADIAAGRELYAQNCAVCHGPQTEGTDQGPSFLSDVYVPSHHADEAFQAAVARGVQPHHWDFGAMPPVPGLTRDQVADITAHVRQLQTEAGLLPE